MERHQVVASTALARYTHIPDNTADPPSAYQNAHALTPNTIQLSKEVLVILEMAHLVFVTCRVFL
jgi:hypothetical protein